MQKRETCDFLFWVTNSGSGWRMDQNRSLVWAWESVIWYCKGLHNSGLDSLCIYLPVSLDHAVYKVSY